MPARCFPASVRVNLLCGYNSATMSFKVVILAVCLTAVLADYNGGDDGPQAPAQYTFQYGVEDDETNVNYGHGEARDGDAIQGSYTVHLPDSRVQKVSYSVNGESGYVADVTYEGQAQYPDEAPASPQYG